MREEEVLNTIRKRLVELDGEGVEEAVDTALEKGYSATTIVMKAMSPAMWDIGKLFETGEYFIAELIEAAEIFKKIMKKIEHLLVKEAASMGEGEKVRIVLGTVKGDVHDIGKTLVALMLRSVGYDVVDLGVDVEAEKFMDAVRKFKPKILGMSALLTTTRGYMKKVIEALNKTGLRKGVKVVIGGAATTRDFAKSIGADAWAKDAVEALKVIGQLAKDP